MGLHRHALRVCATAITLLVAQAVLADELPPSQISTEVGFGYETQTSPLIRISPQGELISIDGLQRLKATSLRVGVQGFANWQLSGGWGLSLAGDMSQKRSPDNPDFNFGMVSVQPALHVAVGPGSVGWGLNWQHIDVAGASFRDTGAVQMDWTQSGPDGSLWAMVVDVGSNRHFGELSDLDAHTASLVVQRHLAKPGAGLESADFAAYVSRERNDQGYGELSYRSMMLTASLQWQWRGVNWSAGTSLQKMQFDDTAMATDPLRVDRSMGVDLAAELDISPKHTLRVEYSRVRSVSTIAMYDNEYQQVAVKLNTAW
jgi:hypothetical protein